MLILSAGILSIVRLSVFTPNVENMLLMLSVILLSVASKPISKCRLGECRGVIMTYVNQRF